VQESASDARSIYKLKWREIFKLGEFDSDCGNIFLIGEILFRDVFFYLGNENFLGLSVEELDNSSVVGTVSEAGYNSS